MSACARHRESRPTHVPHTIDPVQPTETGHRVEFPLELLTDPYFQVSALESILAWLEEEAARVEDELAKPKSLDECFVSAKASSFENLLDPAVLPTRREEAEQLRAVVKLNLLCILRAVCDVHQNRALLVERYGIHEAIATPLHKDGDVLSSTAPKRRATRRPASDMSDIDTPSPPLGTGPMDNPRIASAGTGLAVGTTRGLSPRLRVGNIPWHSGVGTGRC
ncbi:hypothetical protein EDB86DRAFT_3108718 [Lactarius hatsudake]|nr:hypothetical protein EDB86DRAFT_3108718 [Lactarius hatsudake]